MLTVVTVVESVCVTGSNTVGMEVLHCIYNTTVQVGGLRQCKYCNNYYVSGHNLITFLAVQHHTAVRCVKVTGAHG